MLALKYFLGWKGGISAYKDASTKVFLDFLGWKGGFSAYKDAGTEVSWTWTSCPKQGATTPHTKYTENSLIFQFLNFLKNSMPKN